MASELLSELQGIQSLLAGTAASPTRKPPPLAVVRAASTDSELEEEAAVRHPPIPAHRPVAGSQTRELERQVAALRQVQAEGEDKCRRLEAALAAAQQDGELIAGRLRGQLAGKQEECGQLADLVFQLREESEALRAQLQQHAQQAEEQGRATVSSVEQLQAAAGEWRQQCEQGLQALDAERARGAALQGETHRLQERAAQLQAELKEERRQREAAAGELAALRAAVGGPAGGGVSLVSELRQRLALEQGWRKAVRQWLRGEVQTKSELERVLLNVSSAVCCGPAGEPASGSTRHAPSPPLLPPRRMAASQLAPDTAAVHVAAAPDGSSVRVTVRSPRAGMVSVSSSLAHQNGPCGGTEAEGKGSSSGSGWRQHFHATMRAFDERHNKLQQELSGLRREAFQLAD